jgi:hypothetical protein
VEKVERKEGVLGHRIGELKAQLDRIEGMVERLDAAGRSGGAPKGQ